MNLVSAFNLSVDRAVCVGVVSNDTKSWIYTQGHCQSYYQGQGHIVHFLCSKVAVSVVRVSKMFCMFRQHFYSATFTDKHALVCCLMNKFSRAAVPMSCLLSYDRE